MWVASRRLVSAALLALCLVTLAACAPLDALGRTPAPAPPAASVVTPTPTPPPSPTATPSPTPTPALTATATPLPRPAQTTKPTREASRPSIPPSPITTGKAILVSLEHQWLFAYEDGGHVFDSAVETGRPELPTTLGTFSILSKTADTWFTSPWQPGSPYHYEPTHINYAMLFKEGGFYLHDASWHVMFGPGSNVPHQLPDGSWETGSHGCVGMPVSDARRLYEWSRVGVPVFIR